MGSLNPEAEPKQELDDSGYVQDESTKPVLDEYKGSAELLDLSDDVLLYILKNCSPQDLKALGFSCARLGTLILDRTLWVDVDACSAPLGRRRVRWLLTRALGPHTKRLRLKGYAEEADGCLGYANRRLPENSGRSVQEEERYLCGGPRVYRLTQSTPRFDNRALSSAPNKCVGPRLTLTHTALRALGERCPGLTTLELEHCVIDCQTTNIGLFPKTLKRLSLKGTKCFNLESKSFLFKIQDHLSELEELDVSYCSWIEPACVLPLSKLPKLRFLGMRECQKMAEFVAYASLATRYGFKTLEELDLRGSPVGDSEVSALGWLARLARLQLAPAPPPAARRPDHAHRAQDVLPADKELEEWEETEPDYFKPPSISEEEWTRDEEDVRGNRTLASYYANCEDPNSCILLERMIAEPVNPEEYSQVYQQFLAGHNNNVPLADPDEYRESYRQFMERPTHGHPPAGYSLFIRRAEDNGAGPSKRQHNEDDAKPGTSTEDDAKPGTSTDKPTDKNDKNDSDNDSDSKKIRRAISRWGPEKNDSDSDSDGPPSKKHKKKSKKSKKDEDRQPRRVFEITINELIRGQLSGRGERSEARNETRSETVRHQSCQTVDLIPCDSGTLVVDSAMQTEIFRPRRSSSSRRSRSERKSRDSRSDPAAGSSNSGNSGSGDSKSGNSESKSGTSGNGDSKSGSSGNSNSKSGNGDSKSGSSGNGDSKSGSSGNSNSKSGNSGNDDSKSGSSGNGDSKSGSSGNGDSKSGSSDNSNSKSGNGDSKSGNSGNGDSRSGSARDRRDDRRVFQFRQYRRPIVIEEFINVGDEAHGLPRGVLFPGCRTRLDPASLVSDSSIRRFGRATGENVNYIHIGSGGRDAYARPDRSGLVDLSVTGYRHVTDASLVHLATAAPLLRRLDVRGTGVTLVGVERFKAIRPDVEVITDDRIG